MSIIMLLNPSSIYKLFNLDSNQTENIMENNQRIPDNDDNMSSESEELTRTKTDKALVIK